MKCLLVGNFGVGNLGDEALKDYFLQEFSTVDWTVVSADPQGEKEVARLPGGVRSLLKLQWFKTLFAYRSCDAIVFGGGSLFTDALLRFPFKALNSEIPCKCFNSSGMGRPICLYCIAPYLTISAR